MNWLFCAFYRRPLYLRHRPFRKGHKQKLDGYDVPPLENTVSGIIYKLYWIFQHVQKVIATFWFFFRILM